MLRFAISVTTHGFNLHTIGVILMVVGAIGLIVSLLWMIVWADRTRGRRAVVERDVSLERDVPPARY